MTKFNFLIFNFIFFSLFSLFANSSVKAETTIDWEKSLINISMTASLPLEIDVLPEAKTVAENTISDSVSIIIQMAMDHILLNSQSNVYDRLKTNLELTSLLHNFSTNKYKKQSYLTEDFHFLKTEYEIPLYPDFCQAFIQHTRARPIPKKLSYVPAQDYTGIIIFVPKDLPVYGEKKSANLSPCLFPKIYSSNGDLVFSPENISPALLAKKGAVEYVSNLEDVRFEKTGYNPIQIQATALFGENKTDIVIPQYLADSIIYKDNNRDLLAQGKITIVCDPDIIVSKLFFTNK